MSKTHEPDLLTVRFISQYEPVGIRSQRKIERIKDELVPSAFALRKIALAKGLLDSSANETEENQVSQRTVFKTTESFEIHMSMEDAIKLLQDFDSQSSATPDFQEKLDRYRDKKEEVGDPSLLGGELRAQALARLKPFAFESYSVQIMILVPSNDGNGPTEVVRSKKHRRIRKFGESDVKQTISKYGSAIMVDPETKNDGLENPPLSGERRSGGNLNLSSVEADGKVKPHQPDLKRPNPFESTSSTNPPIIS